MPTIKTIQDICTLAQEGLTDWKQYGQVDVKRKGSLLLFNYSHAAQIEGKWNAFEIFSRGLIIDSYTGEIIARSFDKFFNWDEKDRTTNAALRSVTEKLDGVLGILYRDAHGYAIATRGAFESSQAQWAKNFLQRNHCLKSLPDEWTLIFEIIAPGHRIVVDYCDTSALTLLAVRNRFTGEYLPFQQVQEVAAQYHFPIPKVYFFESAAEILELARVIDGTQEGWVAEFTDGQRFKFKGDRYLELHKLTAGLSFKNTVSVVAANSVAVVRDTVPEEFLDEFDGWVEKIEMRVCQKKERVNQVFSNAPKNSRKRFATWVRENHPQLTTYLFARFDEKDIDEILYRLEF